MISSERASQEEQNNANFNFIAPSSECRREVTVDYMLSRSVCISCSGELPSMQGFGGEPPVGGEEDSGRSQLLLEQRLRPAQDDRGRLLL